MTHAHAPRIRTTDTPPSPTTDDDGILQDMLEGNRRAQVFAERMRLSVNARIAQANPR